MQISGLMRNVLWLGFFAAILAAWWVTYHMAVRLDLIMSGQPVSASGAGSIFAPLLHLHSPVPAFWPLFSMWSIMMAAMMLPTLIPSLRTYDSLMASANGTPGGWAGIVAGYLAVWIGGAALFTGLQLALIDSGVVDVLGAARSPVYAAGFLIVAGLFQFSVVKDACQSVCMHPMTYFMSGWRTGTAGGVRMGLGLGAYCVGCCWAIMALGFVGGVMSLLWMGLATVFMVLEKLPQIGRYITKPTGFILILMGCGLLVVQGFTGG